MSLKKYITDYILHKIILVILIIFFFIFTLHSQDKLPIPTYEEKIVGTIIFEGLKATNPKYLLSKISIKEGSIWDEEIKKNVERELLKIDSIVEDVEITTIEKENNIVDVKIEILEKGAFIIVPYFTYSNSKGFIPKVIFRHYNIGGYRKYLNSKVEFLPKESLNLFFKFKDPEANFNENLSYGFETEFKTSLINYNIKGTKPLGVLGMDPPEPEDRWNETFFIQTVLGGELTYIVPYNDIEINPEIKLDYKRIMDKENGAHLPVDILNPKIGLNFKFPIKPIESYIKPSFNVNYKYTFGDEKRTDALELHYNRNRYDKLISDAKLAFSYLIPNFNATLEPYIKIRHELNNSYFYANESLDSLIIEDTWYDDYLDLIFGVDFKKSFRFWKIRHTFKIKTEFEQRLYGDTTITKVYNTNEDKYTNYYPYNFMSLLDFTYEFDYNTFKSHHFKMKYLIFTRYNQIKIINKYKPGVNPGHLEGFAGIIGNIKYELPIFDIETPKFVSINMKRPLKWQIFWDFFLDFGLSVTDLLDYKKDYTILDRNLLHLYPALGFGTALRFLPKFVPIEIVLEVGADIYDIYKQRTINGSNIYISFSIEDKF